jgi:hypothetical protein
MHTTGETTLEQSSESPEITLDTEDSFREGTPYITIDYGGRFC